MHTVKLILDRQPGSLEFFLRLPADALRAVLQTDPAPLADAAGVVQFGELRETGTFDFGDEMISRLGLQISGHHKPVEAMSVMVHSREEALRFDTPLDGAIAISVCGTPEPDSPPNLRDLMLYAGFIAYPVNGLEVLEITWPNTAPFDLEVTEFAHHQKAGAPKRQRIEAGDTLTLAKAREPSVWQRVLSGLGLG